MHLTRQYLAPTRGSHSYFHYTHQETESNSAQKNSSKGTSIVIGAQEQTPKNFLRSQLIQHIIYRNIKRCQEFLSPQNSRGKGPIKSSSVSYNIIHLDPGVLIASNISNSSSCVKFYHGYRDQSYTRNHILGLMRQWGFFIFQGSKYCDLSPGFSPTTFLSWLNITDIIPCIFYVSVNFQETVFL